MQTSFFSKLQQWLSVHFWSFLPYRSGYVTLVMSIATALSVQDLSASSSLKSKCCNSSSKSVSAICSTLANSYQLVCIHCNLITWLTLIDSFLWFIQQPSRGFLPPPSLMQKQLLQNTVWRCPFTKKGVLGHTYGTMHCLKCRKCWCKLTHFSSIPS